MVYEGRNHRSSWEQRGVAFQSWIAVAAADDGPVAAGGSRVVTLSDACDPAGLPQRRPAPAGVILPGAGH